MTLPDRIQLINDMIRENRDARICDYLEALPGAEIKAQQMNKPTKYTVDDALFMMRHAEDFTAPEMADNLNLDVNAVYNFGSRNKLAFKAVTEPKKRKEPQHLRSVHADAPKVPIIRAPAVYDNLKTNYL